MLRLKTYFPEKLPLSPQVHQNWSRYDGRAIPSSHLTLVSGKVDSSLPTSFVGSLFVPFFFVILCLAFILYVQAETVLTTLKD